MTSEFSPNVILRRQQVQARSGLPRSTMYLRMTQGLWTRPISLGARSVGWPASEVEALNAARIAGRSEEQIRQLVRQLEALRIEPSSRREPGEGRAPQAGG